MTKTYGAGASATKLNIGAVINSVSKLDATGKVTDQSGVVFDPATDKVELKQADGKLSHEITPPVDPKPGEGE